MIEVSGLRKEYGGFAAVEGSTFSVGEGEVFGIVGPNGAGKTTTLKALAGLIEPTAGTVEVTGHAPGDPAARERLGFLPEESPLYEEMTARSYLHFFADLYDVPHATATERIEDALDRLELEHRDRPLGDVSKGMKRKVAIARSLVNDPDVLVYDEPASGLDPLTTNYVIDFTRELAESGRTVVFSAHNLYHVESVCDRIAVMHEGAIIAQGTAADLRETHGRTEYRVFTTVPVDGSEPVDGDEDGDGDGDGGTKRHRTTVGSMDGVERVRAAAERAGGSVADIRTVEPSLESVFLRLARDADGAAGDAEDGTPGTEAGPGTVAPERARGRSDGGRRSGADESGDSPRGDG